MSPAETLARRMFAGENASSFDALPEHQRNLWISRAQIALAATPSATPEPDALAVVIGALKPFATLKEEIERLAAETGLPADTAWAKSCSWEDLVRAVEALTTLRTAQQAPGGAGSGSSNGAQTPEDEWPPFRCRECDCRSYAKVDERKPDGSFGPGPLIRCVECKRTYPFASIAPGGAGSADRVGR